MIVRGAETVAERARGREKAAKEQLSSRVSVPQKNKKGKKTGGGRHSCLCGASQQLLKLKPRHPL